MATAAAVDPENYPIGLSAGGWCASSVRWCFCSGYLYFLIWMIQVGLGHRKGGPDHANIP